VRADDEEEVAEVAEERAAAATATPTWRVGREGEGGEAGVLCSLEEEGILGLGLLCLGDGFLRFYVPADGYAFCRALCPWSRR
jgi:hypothetical protein